MERSQLPAVAVEDELQQQFGRVDRRLQSKETLEPEGDISDRVEKGS